MPSDIAIRAEGLSKRYRIGALQQAELLRDALAGFVRHPLATLARARAEQPHIWALKDVSFELHRGDVVGIIGRNGAGKSTLLKILSRITEPTEGRASLYGRVGSLLEVGTGFHPDLTGRENIYLNGAILGLRKADIDRKLDAIVDFAEIDRFVDTAVKYYSSGMYVRLAFAVAAHLEPEILIVDEVLAVGDVAFQRKCLGKMDDVARGGRTVLFVSHNMAAVHRLATSAILLEQGRVTSAGPARSVIAQYLSAEQRAQYRATAPNGRPQIIEADIVGADGRALARPLCTEPFAIRFRYALPDRHPGLRIGIGLLSGEGITVFTSNSDDAQMMVPSAAGEYEARATVPANTLIAGDYHVALCLWDQADILDLQEPALSFPVEPGPSVLYGANERKGFVQVACAWSVEAVETSGAPLEAAGRR